MIKIVSIIDDPLKFKHNIINIEVTKICISEYICSVKCNEDMLQMIINAINNIIAYIYKQSHKFYTATYIG